MFCQNNLVHLAVFFRCQNFIDLVTTVLTGVLRNGN